MAVRRELERSLLGSVAALASRGPVVAIDDGFTVAEALAVLRQRNFLSVPVVRRGDEARVVGVLNLVDVATAAVFQPVFNRYDTDTEIALVDRAVMDEAQRVALFDRPAAELLGVSRESRSIWAFGAGDALGKVVEAFSSGVHRALFRPGEPTPAAELADPMAAQLRLFSQTDLVRELRARPALAAVWVKPARASQRAALAHLVGAEDEEREAEREALEARRALVSLRGEQTALTGFRRMLQPDESPLSALPVVDDDGRLVASLSLSDLRGFRKDFFNLVLLPVREFLSFVHEKVPRPVTCRRGEPIGAIADRVLAARVHRAWVVDDEGRPVGVVSLSDMLLAVRCAAHDELQAELASGGGGGGDESKESKA